jgi:lysophospholipase L1-like esterase
MAAIAPSLPTTASGNAPDNGPSMAGTVQGWPRPSQLLGPRPTRQEVAPRRRGQRPVSGPQLYAFRRASLAGGELYPQAQAQRYLAQWQRAIDPPTYEQWLALLAAEAEAMAQRQGDRSLTIVVGDSLAQWLPLGNLPPQQLWLNQSVSGETTAHMLDRLSYFADTRPRAIHIMGGINDLKQGVPEAEVVNNLAAMLTRLHQQHPQARLVVYSILPTRLGHLPSDRIQRVNRQLAAIATRRGATFVDLHPSFSDAGGQLRPELTTDGLHLSPQGYVLWRSALVSH